MPSSFKNFDGPVLTEILQFLSPKEWSHFASCASWCQKASEADVLWKFAAESIFRLDTTKINISGGWKSLVCRMFGHHPPKIEHFLAGNSNDQQQQFQRLGKWQRIMGLKNTEDMPTSRSNSHHLHLNLHSLLEKDLSIIAERTSRRNIMNHQPLANNNAPTKITSFVVSKNGSQSIVFKKIHDQIGSVVFGTSSSDHLATFNIEFPETLLLPSSENNNNNNKNHNSLCEMFILDLFPRDEESFSSTSNVFILALVDDEVARKTLLIDQQRNTTSNHSSSDEENTTNQQQPQLLPVTPLMGNNNNNNNNETTAERRNRRAVAIGTLEKMMELLYSISCSVVITLSPTINSTNNTHTNTDAVAAAADSASNNEIGKHHVAPCFLEALLHVSAADQSIPEWTVPSHFANTLFLCCGGGTSSVPVELISDTEWKEFVKNHLYITSPAASSVSLFFATRSREAFYGSELGDLLQMSLKFSSYSARSVAPSLQHPYFISWNIAPGLFSRIPQSEEIDIGLSPSLDEYLFFLASAIGHQSASSSSYSRTTDDGNNNNNGLPVGATWWSSQLVMSLVQPQMKKIMSKFERHMKEDDDHLFTSQNQDIVKVAPLTSSNLHKMNREYEKQQRLDEHDDDRKQNNHNSDRVELIPDLEAHQALMALSDASETASSHGTRDQTRSRTNTTGTRRTAPARATNNNNNDPDNTTAASVPRNAADNNNNNNNDDDEYEFGDNEEDIIAQRILAAFNAADDGQTDDATVRLMLNGQLDDVVVAQQQQQRNSSAATPSSATQLGGGTTAAASNIIIVNATPGPNGETSVTPRSNVSMEDNNDEDISNGNPKIVASQIQQQQQQHLERVHGRCSALPAESPQSYRVPQHTSEFWSAHSRHAKMAFEFALEVARPYCTTRNFSLLVADAVRNQIDEVTRRLWSSFSDQSESYCTELVHNVFKHLRANYGSLDNNSNNNNTSSEYRREKNALKKWFSSAHEKIEEYLIKARGPRRLHVLQHFVNETFVPEFVASCEADAVAIKKLIQQHARKKENENETDVNGGEKEKNKFKAPNLIHPEDARQACSCLIREVDGMILRCDTNPMNDPRRLEFLKVAKFIALRFGDEIDATVTEHIMDAATASSIFDRRLTIRLHSISPSSSGAVAPSNNNNSNNSSVTDSSSNNNNRNHNREFNPNPQQQQQIPVQHQQQQQQPPQGNRGSVFLRSAVNFFSNMLHSNGNNNSSERTTSNGNNNRRS